MTGPINETVATFPEPKEQLLTPEEHAVSALASSSSNPPAAPAPSSDGPHRTILIPVEESVHSVATIRWARSNFLRPSDKVVLVNVRPYQQVYLADLGADLLVAVNDLESAARQKSHDLIRTFARYLTTPVDNEPKMVVPADVEGFAIRGDARYDITRKATEVHATAVVMGCRGLGAFKRAMLGSVSAYVSSHSPAPVVIVRPDNMDLTKAHEDHKEIAKGGQGLYYKLKPGQSVTPAVTAARANVQ